MSMIKMKMNSSDSWTVIRQPDTGLSYNFETTYTSDSTRVQSGSAHFTPLFTVEQLGYEATSVSEADMHEILQFIIKGRPFYLYYHSAYYGAWRSGRFRVGKGEYTIGAYNNGTGQYDSLKFNMTGDEPI